MKADKIENSLTELPELEAFERIEQEELTPENTQAFLNIAQNFIDNRNYDWHERMGLLVLQGYKGIQTIFREDKNTGSPLDKLLHHEVKSDNKEILGYFINIGISLKKDYNLGLKLLTSAAVDGNKDTAAMKLALIFAQADKTTNAVEANLINAKKFLLLAAERQNLLALYYIHNNSKVGKLDCGSITTSEREGLMSLAEVLKEFQFWKKIYPRYNYNSYFQSNENSI